MKKCDSFIQPINPIGGTYPTNWPGYYHLQPRAAEGRPDLRHLGDDYNGPGGGNSDLGYEVKCLGNGVVEAIIFWNGKYGFGNHVFVRHELTEELYQALKNEYGIDSRIVYSHYAHLQGISSGISVGQEIDKGHKIGTLGNSGTQYAHEHQELRKGTGLGYESYPSDRPVEWLKQYYFPPYPVIQKYLNPIQPSPTTPAPTTPAPTTSESTSTSSSSTSTSSSSSTTPPPIIPPTPDPTPPIPPTPIPPVPEPPTPVPPEKPNLLQLLINLIKSIIEAIWPPKKPFEGGGGEDTTMNPGKSGIKTTEFWMTLVPQIATILVVVGVLPSEDVDSVVKMVAGVIAGIVSLVSLVAYVWSRVQIKKESMRIEGTRV